MSELKIEPLFQKVVEKGKRVTRPRSAEEIAKFSNQQLNKLPGEFKRFENPHVYKV